jgi:hypothetical protein
LKYCNNVIKVEIIDVIVAMTSKVSGFFFLINILDIHMCGGYSVTDNALLV